MKAMIARRPFLKSLGLLLLAFCCLRLAPAAAWTGDGGTDAVITAKAFPFFRTVARNRALADGVRWDAWLHQQHARQRERMRRALVECADAGCYAEAAGWSPGEIEAIGNRLAALVRDGGRLGALGAALRAEAAYPLYAAREDADLVRSAWTDSARGVNRILEVYVGGKKPLYPAIDAISFPEGDPAFRERVRRRLAGVVRGGDGRDLFFGAPLEFALWALAAGSVYTVVQRLLTASRNPEALEHIAADLRTTNGDGAYRCGRPANQRTPLNINGYTIEWNTHRVTLNSNGTSVQQTSCGTSQQQSTLLVRATTQDAGATHTRETLVSLNRSTNTPRITSFTTNLTEVRPGETVTLNWQLAANPPAGTVTYLDGERVRTNPTTLRGSTTLQITETTRLELVADSPFGRDSRNLTIEAGSAPIFRVLRTTPERYTPGKPLTTKPSPQTPKWNAIQHPRGSMNSKPLSQRRNNALPTSRPTSNAWTPRWRKNSMMPRPSPLTPPRASGSSTSFSRPESHSW